MFFIVVSFFSLGFISGVAVMAGYALYRLRRFNIERMKFAQEITKTTKELKQKADSAKERINKALDICEEQFNILSGLEGPQSGPLHGRHKQRMNSELKRLEEEKMTILKSVLAEGYDPKLVTISESGERESVKLSDFIKQHEMHSEDRYSDNPPAIKATRRLSIVKNKDSEESK